MQHHREAAASLSSADGGCLSAAAGGEVYTAYLNNKGIKNQCVFFTPLIHQTLWPVFISIKYPRYPCGFTVQEAIDGSARLSVYLSGRLPRFFASRKKKQLKYNGQSAGPTLQVQLQHATDSVHLGILSSINSDKHEHFTYSCF